MADFQSNANMKPKHTIAVAKLSHMLKYLNVGLQPTNFN